LNGSGEDVEKRRSVVAAMAVPRQCHQLGSPFCEYSNVFHSSHYDSNVYFERLESRQQIYF
jgi:hypothetical protein